MPNLIQGDEKAVKELEKVDMKPRVEIKILTGVVVNESTDFVTVDEMKPKRPVRVKMRRAPSIPVQEPQKNAPENIKENKEEKRDDNDTLPTQSVNPTPPVGRESRSNSLKMLQGEDVTQKMSPLMMPRRQINQTYISIESVDDTNEQEQPTQVVKSILKTGDESYSAKPVQHITFLNVPDSSSSSLSEDESTEEEIQDVWTKIDKHRIQLKRLQDMESVSGFYENDSSLHDESDIEDQIPPLPKTPPPIIDEQSHLRDFSFA